jgi:hypothetical protein
LRHEEILPTTRLRHWEAERSNAGVREVGAKRGPGHRSGGPWLLGAFPSDPPEASPPGRPL